MKIRFSALYPEVDTSFSIHHELYKMLRDGLNSLGKDIPYLSKEIADDFTLSIIVSATRKSSELLLNGPVFVKKNKLVEFVPKIPYVPNMTFSEQVIYVFHNLESIFLTIFENYNSDSSGISEVFRAVECEFLANEEKYRC